METAEAVTRQSANAASLSARTAELERSGMPLSTTTKSGGWRRTSRRAPVQTRRRRSTGSLGVDAEEQTPRRYDHHGKRLFTPPKLGFFGGDFTPKMGSNVNETPKRHILARVRVV